MKIKNILEVNDQPTMAKILKERLTPPATPATAWVPSVTLLVAKRNGRSIPGSINDGDIVMFDGHDRSDRTVRVHYFDGDGDLVSNWVHESCVTEYTGPIAGEPEPAPAVEPAQRTVLLTAAATDELDALADG